MKEVKPVKSFGEKQSLKATANYKNYVKWDDVAVSWVVSASHQLKFEPKIWSFPLVGSLNYLGWFSREDAKELADQLKSEGWDVYLRGASAFSTLGWFQDPVLSTMLGEGKGAMGRLVNVILHESVHATLYVPDQSYFNESLASFIADYLANDYLIQKFGKSNEYSQAYLRGLRENEIRTKLLNAAYRKLEIVYSQKSSNEVKMKKKQEIVLKLQKDLNLKAPVNNALLIQYKTYGTGRKDFLKLFDQCQNDWNRFWKALNQLSSETFQEIQQENFSEILANVRNKTCS